MKKIIVIHLSRMGDMLQSIPFLASLKNRFPGSQVSLLAYRKFFKIISSSNYVDQYIDLFDKRYIKAFLDNYLDEHTTLSLVKSNELLTLEYDLLFNLTHNISSARLSSHINAKKKAGALLVDGEMEVKNDWCKYFFSVSKKREENLFNIVNIYQGIAGCFTKTILDYYSDDFLRRGKDFLATFAQIRTDKKIIAIHPGANLESKQWDIDYFLRLIEIIDQNLEVTIILLGSHLEKEIGSYIESRIDKNILNLIGLTKIEYLPGIIGEVDLMVSGDSGLSHIAASAGVKTITISFGAVYFAETAPYGDGNIIIVPEIDCYPCKSVCANIDCKRMISVESVFNAMRVSLLDENYVGVKNSIAYITKLGKDSLMYYYPLSKNVSNNFIKGVVNHYLWSSFFVFPVNGDYYNFILNNYNKTSMQDLLSYHQDIYNDFNVKYTNAIKILENYLGLKDSIAKNSASQSMNSFLQDFEEEILLSKESIFKYFHQYEMLDFSQVDNGDILKIVLDKYYKLYQITEMFLNKISFILRSA